MGASAPFFFMCYGKDDRPEWSPQYRKEQHRQADLAREQARTHPTSGERGRYYDTRLNKWRFDAKGKPMTRQQALLADSVQKAQELRDQREAAAEVDPAFYLTQDLPEKKSTQKAALKIGSKSSVKTGNRKGKKGSTATLRTPMKTINI